MALSKSLVAAFVASTVASAASAATFIDFTDTTKWPSGTLSTNYGGLTVTLTSTGGAVAQTAFNPIGALGPLAGGSDGLGVEIGDEISFPEESITVTFSSNVRVVGLYYLDLFRAPDGSEEEEAVATFAGGAQYVTAAQPGLGQPFRTFGFAFQATNDITNSITFTAQPTNDARGEPDYALAAIELAPIPLPAAGWLFLSALGGMGLLARKRAA